jgi:phospholipase C
MNRWVRAIALAVKIALVSACAPPRQSFDVAARTHFQHVIIVVQENRSFDNLFHGFSGADTAEIGIAHDGTRVRLQPVSLAARYDISNSVRDFTSSYDRGKMDGFDLRMIGPRPGAEVPLQSAQYPQYAFVPRHEVDAYFQIGQHYALADRMFQSNIDQSFAAHLYLIAGQANRTANVPTGRPWGCDAGPRARVATLNEDRTLGKHIFPCFDLPTLADELESKRLSWAYYAPRVLSNVAWRKALSSYGSSYIRAKDVDIGQLWSAFDAIPHARYGPSWASNVISPSARVLTDISSGQLRNVSWIVPDFKNSDHAGSKNTSGPSWVAAIVNAVGHSKYWRDTVVLITWDDAGGWYDHVAPPHIDYDGLGMRVPLLIVSPYTKRAFVSHEQYEFGSILRFTESVFDLRSLAASDSRANNLESCFDFTGPPRPFETILAPLAASRFVREDESFVPPDDD